MSRARDLANSADKDITGTLTVDDITLSGNITVGGTVDGRDIATDGTKLDGVEANATADQTGAEIKAAYEGEADTNAYTDAEKTKLSGIEAGATADQTKADIDALNINADTLDGQHGSYYTAYADTAVSNLVDSAPTTLDTLNELAAALGDDPNFATTVTASIGTKLNSSDYTAADVLTKIKTVDGSGSGLDADTLDGVQGSSFLRSDTADTINNVLTVSSSGYFKGNTTSGYRFNNAADSLNLLILADNGNATFHSSTITAGGNTVWHAGNDGSGSGLDADTLDGSHASSFQTRSLTDSSRNINLLQSNGGGSAGIFLGDSNGSFRMQLYGDGSNYGFLNAKWGSWSLKVDSSSNLYMTGNVTAYSDERLKDNVVTIDNALDKVSAIRGVTYNRNDIEDAPRHAGVIAQEVEKVLPEVVQTDEDGIKTVAYGNMVGLLIEAIKELKAEIEELKNGSTN